MKVKLLLIYNPNSGKGQIKQNLSGVIEELFAGGFIVTVFPTQKPKDATKYVVENAENYDLIVCAGGDGTLHEVTEGLMLLPENERIPCGYIPAGTVNDFATSLHIPKDMINAAKAIVQGRLFKYDIGSLNKKYFTYIAGFGAFMDVSYDTPQITKNIFGRAAYFLEGIKQLTKISPVKMQIECNGVTINDEFIIGMVMNTYSVAGFVNLKEKDILLDDGEFESLFIKNPTNALELQETLADITRRNTESKHYYTLRSSKIVCTADSATPWTIDGEFGGKIKRAEIINHPRAIEYVVSKNYIFSLIEGERN